MFRGLHKKTFRELRFEHLNIFTSYSYVFLYKKEISSVYVEQEDISKF